MKGKENMIGTTAGIFIIFVMVIIMKIVYPEAESIQAFIIALQTFTLLEVSRIRDKNKEE
jgi:hypothetical protein